MRHNFLAVGYYLMASRHILFGIHLVLISIILGSCSNTRHLPKGENLYLGSTVKIHDKEGTRKYRKIVVKDLQGAVRPKPNSDILGVRLKLSIYNLAGDTSKKGPLRRAIRNFGEAPVLASSLDLADNNKKFLNILHNRGFFFCTVKSDSTTRRRKTRAHFDVWTGPQYKIRNVEFPIDTEVVASNRKAMQASVDMAAAKGNTLLKKDQPYNLDLIKGERDRIDRVMTEQGYYYFSSDYIIVQADTSVGNHQVDMYVRLKHEEIPEQAYYIFKINSVFVYPNYRLNGASRDTSLLDAKLYGSYYVVDKSNIFKPIVFTQAMQFRQDDVYNRTKQNMALNRLVSLGSFKFVKNRFDPIFIPSDPRLDVYYYLTPQPRKALRFEIGALSESDGRTGTNSSLSWRHRNAFKGAELFVFTLRGGYEVQSGGTISQRGVFEGGSSISLSVPRFWIPFFKVTPSSIFIPRTELQVGYDISLRSQVYLINSFKGSYGYRWKGGLRNEHQLYPINITYVTTDTLGTPSLLNIDYSNILFNGLIIGPTYQYTYNSQASGLRRDNYYFNGLIDLSPFPDFKFRLSPTDKNQPEYSQYMKYLVDGRYYRNYSAQKNDIWASRLLIGWGVPFGNTSKLPNIKQFYSGGASSLRGFPARMVGPGTYNQKYLYGDATQNRFVEMLGDIKIEMSTELRTKVYQFVNAAVFVDAGNIWLYNDDPKFPGGKFTADFYKQLAVDAGIGLRFDFNVVLFRLDVATPIRKPWLPQANSFSLGSNSLGSDLVFNLAIGYPF